MEFAHTPVLLDETIEGLKIQAQGTYVDCTVGGGGHSLEILKRLPGGHLIAIDQDEEALEAAKKNLASYKDQVTFVHANFKDFNLVLDRLKIDQVDGILMDLGVSSYQLDEPERGFSYHDDALLDMRMDHQANIPTAADIVNTYSEDQLTQIFYEYGGEKWARRIARFIIADRKDHKIQTTLDLVTTIKKAIPKQVRRGSKHPARKVFQALRIEVNHELDVLKKSLESCVDRLKPGGRICVISFHSLEDRIVKNSFRDMTKDCICPPDFPICVCDHVRKLKLVNKKPIQASKEEVETNFRSRSAKLRIGERIEKVEKNNAQARL